MNVIFKFVLISIYNCIKVVVSGCKSKKLTKQSIISSHSIVIGQFFTLVTAFNHVYAVVDLILSLFVDATQIITSATKHLKIKNEKIYKSYLEPKR